MDLDKLMGIVAAPSNHESRQRADESHQKPQNAQDTGEHKETVRTRRNKAGKASGKKYVIFCALFIAFATIAISVACITLGYRAWYSLGEKDGRREAQEELALHYEQKRNEIYEQGVAEGTKQGYEQGVEEGTKCGYEQGVADAQAKQQDEPHQGGSPGEESSTDEASPQSQKSRILFSRHINSGAVKAPSNEVRRIQVRLILSGHLADKADGVFGPITERAVMAFQSDNGIEATGNVDQATYDALFKTNKEPHEDTTGKPSPSGPVSPPE